MKKRVNYLSLRISYLIITGLSIVLLSCKQSESAEPNLMKKEGVESYNQDLSEKMNMISTLIGEDYTSNNRKEMQIMMSQLLIKLHYDSAYLFQYTYPIDGYKATGAFFNYRKSKNGIVYGNANIYEYNGDTVKSFEIQNFELPDSVFNKFRLDKINVIDEKIIWSRKVCY